MMGMIVLVFIVIGAVAGDLNSYELTNLYNSEVTYAEYYERPLPSSGSSSVGKRVMLRDWKFVHAGVVVTTTYNGHSRWLIHKGKDYGDSSSTVITSAGYMSSSWTRKHCGRPFGQYTVARFMDAAAVNENYGVFAITGANCQTAAHGMWKLVNEVQC